MTSNADDVQNTLESGVAMATGNIGVKKAICLHGGEAIESILTEFENLFFVKKALKCLKPN